MWSWPNPGFPENGKKFYKYKGQTGRKISKNFVLFQLIISEVELIEIKNTIHKRSLWSKENNWRETTLNP